MPLISMPNSPEISYCFHQHQQSLLWWAFEKEAVPKLCALSCCEAVHPVSLDVTDNELKSTSVVSSLELCLLSCSGFTLGTIIQIRTESLKSGENVLAIRR